MSKTSTLDLGLVVTGHGRHYLVEMPDGRRVICHPRGKKSDCVVGDRVRWQASGDEGVIEHVEPRRNLLFRQDEWKTKSFAANLDQLIVLVAAEPVFSESQLARALIAAESAGIPVRILLNKADLPSIVAARERLRPYAAFGIEVVELALKAQPDAASARLHPLLAGKAYSYGALVWLLVAAGARPLRTGLLVGAVLLAIELAQLATPPGEHFATLTDPAIALCAGFVLTVLGKRARAPGIARA